MTQKLNNSPKNTQLGKPWKGNDINGLKYALLLRVSFSSSLLWV